MTLCSTIENNIIGNKLYLLVIETHDDIIMKVNSSWVQLEKDSSDRHLKYTINENKHTINNLHQTALNLLYEMTLCSTIEI